jgi:hypothetical protein
MFENILSFKDCDKKLQDIIKEISLNETGNFSLDFSFINIKEFRNKNNDYLIGCLVVIIDCAEIIRVKINYISGDYIIESIQKESIWRKD